jgi:high affinity sulfate transporter 1
MSDLLPDSSQRPLARWIPSVGWVRGYDKSWLRPDLLAGLTGASVVVPQSMAYAAIAGLPLVMGLYTALVPLVVYAIMGTSRVLSVTTTSTIAILTASALREVPLGPSDAALLETCATLAFLVGVTLLVASTLRLGVVATFISDPVLVGFKAGVGLTIVLDQIPKLLGENLSKGHFFHDVISILNHLPQASVPTVVLGVAMLALLLGLEHYFPHVPASLVTVAVGIIVSAVAGLGQHGIELVGEVKGGLPSITLPKPAMFDRLWPGAIGIALMSFVETAAAGRAFQNADEPAPQANKELFAIGMANVVGSFFQNMPSGGGTSQTAVSREAGARTQVAGLLTAAVVLAVLMFLAPAVQYMPLATLAAVVVVPCAAMIHPHAFAVLYRFRLMEYSWAIAALVGVLLLGTLKGILVAVLLSLMALVYHTNRRPIVVLARKPGTDVFRPISSEHPQDETFPGLLLIKTEGTMHFANAGRIMDRVMQLINEGKPRVMVLDCSAVPDFEYTAMSRLIDMDKKLSEAGITLWLAALNPEPLISIEKSEFGKTRRERMFFNLEQAVQCFLSQSDGAKPGRAS